MRSFDIVLEDIRSLIGLRLKSIRPGADLVLTGIDSSEKRFLLKTANGDSKSRPFSEIEAIVKALNVDGIAHVETVLAGSGSSRNQPETILANLPYIEYTFINRKKHLVIRDEPTHPAGHLQELDPIQAKKIIDRFKVRQTSLPVQVIVTSNLREATMSLVAAGGDLKALSPAAYSVTIQRRTIWIVTPDALKCSKESAYAILSGTPSAKAVFVGELFGNSLFEEPKAFVIVSRPS